MTDLCQLKSNIRGYFVKALVGYLLVNDKAPTYDCVIKKIEQ